MNLSSRDVRVPIFRFAQAQHRSQRVELADGDASEPPNCDRRVNLDPGPLSSSRQCKSPSAVWDRNRRIGLRLQLPSLPVFAPWVGVFGCPPREREIGAYRPLTCLPRGRGRWSINGWMRGEQPSVFLSPDPFSSRSFDPFCLVQPIRFCRVLDQS